MAEPPLSVGAVQVAVAVVLPAVAVPMVGAAGAVTTGPVLRGVPGVPAPVDSAQLVGSLLSLAGSRSSRDCPSVGIGQPSPP